MLVVNIRKVWMGVPQGPMAMLVDVRFMAVPRELVGMLMMSIVRMWMAVNELLVNMLVLVILGEMQPHTHDHACSSHPEGDSRRLSVQRNRYRAAHERRCRKVSSC